MIEQMADRRGGTDRRMTRFAFRFPDRRRGFVRRQIHGGRVRGLCDRTLAAYRDSPQSLAVVLASVVMLNIADLLLTLRAVYLGAAEVNPIMAALIDADPLLASLFKATIVMGVVAAMWAMRRYRRVLEASLVLLGGFVVLILYSAATLLVAG